MGGTSCDVCLIVGGEPLYSSDFEIEFGLPVSVPSVSTTHDRRRRRLDRLGRPGRLPPGRPAERGRRSRPCRYGQGGEERDDHRRQRRARPARSRRSSSAASFRWIPSARTRRSTRSAASSGWIGVETASADGAHLPTRTWRTRSASSRSSEGIDPREFAMIAFGGAGATHACEIAEAIGMRARDRAAAPGPLLGVRRAGRDRARGCRAQRLPHRSHDLRRRARRALRASSRRRPQADVAAQGLAQKPRCGASSRCATRARTTSRRSACRRGRSTTRRSPSVYAELRPPLRGVLRLPARRHPDRARAALGRRRWASRPCSPACRARTRTRR